MEKYDLGAALFEDAYDIYVADLGALGVKDDGHVRIIFNDGKDNVLEDIKAQNNYISEHITYTVHYDDGTEREVSKVYSVDFNEVLSERTRYIVGDVDEDGVITSNDALAILRFSVEVSYPQSTKEFISCLIDQDDEITSADALYVLRYSVGLSDDTAHQINQECIY